MKIQHLFIASGFIVFCFLIPLKTVQAQRTIELQRALLELSNYFDQNALEMMLVYEEQKQEGGDFLKIASCKMIKDRSTEKVVFNEYETLTNDSIYVKVTHDDKKLYVIKNELEEIKQQPSGLISTFDSGFLNNYKIKLDTIESDAKNGHIVFTGQETSVYESIKLKYDVLTKQPQRYQINYQREASPELASLRIVFQSIEKVSTQKLAEEFALKQYVKIETEKVIPVSKYKDYKIIKNF